MSADESPPAPPRLGPEQVERVIAAVQEHVNAVALPAWPVFGLAEPDAPGWLCGVSDGGTGGVTALRIDYRPPGGEQRLLVQSELGGADLAPGGDVVFDRLEDAHDEGEPLELYAAPGRTESASGTATEVLVGPEMLPATRRERGAAGTLVWLVTGGVTVVIAARGVPLEHVALQSISDLTPVKEERLRVVRRFLTGRPLPPAPYGR